MAIKLAVTTLFLYTLTFRSAPAQIPTAKVTDQTPSSQPATETPEAFIEQIKKTIVFIKTPYKRMVPISGAAAAQTLQEKDFAIEGTGFLIQIPAPELNPQAIMTLLVTNRHMIREPGPDGAIGSGPYANALQLKFNRKAPKPDGNSFDEVTVPVMNENGQLNCFVNETDLSLDLAICPVHLDTDDWDTKELSENFFVTPQIIKSEHIDESTELFFAGLFVSFEGNKRNIPIVRHGKIAMMPEEQIGASDYYLADVMSFGGNSGSPVFVRTGGFQDSGPVQPKYYLLGIMQGFFPVDSPVAVETGILQGAAKENTGVAAVIPASKILEILALPSATACLHTGISNVLGSLGRFSEALSLASKVDTASVSKSYQECVVVLNGIISEMDRRLNMPTKASTAEIPKPLWWRNVILRPVSVKFRSSTGPTKGYVPLFLLKDDADSYYFLKPNDADVQGTPIQVKKSDVEDLK